MTALQVLQVLQSSLAQHWARDWRPVLCKKEYETRGRARSSGVMLTGFAMRSDPKGFSEVSAPLTAEAQALGARELRRIGLILAPHLASRHFVGRDGPARTGGRTHCRHGVCSGFRLKGSGNHGFWSWRGQEGGETERRRDGETERASERASESE